MAPYWTAAKDQSLPTFPPCAGDRLSVLGCLQWITRKKSPPATTADSYTLALTYKQKNMSTHIFKILHIFINSDTYGYPKVVNLFSILEMEVYKCTHLYTHLSFSLSFLGSSCQVHPGIQELYKISVSDLSLSSLTLLEVPFQSVQLSLTTAMNFRHNNKMLTIMAFTQLCLWDALASYSDCNSALPFVLPTYTLEHVKRHMSRNSTASFIQHISASWNKSRPIWSMKNHEVYPLAELQLAPLGGAGSKNHFQNSRRWIEIKGVLVTVTTVQQNLN